MPSLGKRHLSLLPVTLALATGVFAAPAQAAGGTALGWGLNDYGQTGIGSVSTTGCKCVVTPSPVAGISEVTEISAGSRFALALLSDGTVRSWGNNSYGELAHGESNSSVPVTVNGLPGGVVAIAAGAFTGYALLANGTVMAWGGNEAGQLGQGESTGPHACEKGSPCSRTPVLVQGLSNVIAIASGGRYLLALRADGTVMIWGSDTYGQLGDGDTQPGCICVDHPVPVPGLSGIVGVGGGYYEAGAAAEDGTGRAWGYNGTGIAGNGTTEGVASCECIPPTAPTGLSGVREIDFGQEHALALLADGTARSWGLNEGGQLGVGFTTLSGCSCIPTPSPVLGLTGATAISATANSNLALLGDGTVRAWGLNSNGELGNGTTEPSYVPVATSLSGVTSVVGGELGSYALVGASRSLTVSLAGTGTGVVGTRGLVCPAACSARYPVGQVEFLRASPDAAFAGFSGPCIGTGPCQVRMDSDQTVTATFGVPKGTAITKAKINSAKKKATFRFSAPGAITGYQCKLVKPAAKKSHGAKKSAKKAKKAKFTACSSPKAYKNLKPGPYSFSVRALDRLGSDPKPALKKFKISRRRSGGSRHRAGGRL